MKTTATTEAVSSPPEENEHWNTKWRRTTSCAGKKPAADLKKDLQIQEAGRKSQKSSTTFVGIKPNGKSRLTSSPAIGIDGMVYIGGDDGILYAIQGAAGPASSPWPMWRKNNTHQANAAP